MCACKLKIVGGIGSIWVLWLLRLLSLHHRGNWIKIIVFRIANLYNILRQISNLPQLRTSAATGYYPKKVNSCLWVKYFQGKIMQMERFFYAAHYLSLRCHFGILKINLLG
jgi:hypothetical protein